MSLAGNVNLLAQSIGGQIKSIKAALLRLGYSTPVSLTDAASITTDASLGNLFRVTITAARTFSAPTNAQDGQRIMYEITASGGAWTPVFTTGATGAFKFGTDFTAIPSIASGTTAYVGCLYSARDSRWHILAVGSGH